jgi:hypothetical protein
MAVVIVKEAKLVVVKNDLDFKIKNVTFEAKVLNRYGTFDRIANRSMEDQAMHICIKICWIGQL